MYMAELKGKLPDEVRSSEDILTSDVFSFFKYADRRVFLKSFLHILNLQVSDHEAENAEFLFWPRYPDNTEPDLVIIVGQYYLLIEAKFRSSFEWRDKKEQSQLYREIEGGLAEARNLDKQFYLITVTADYIYRHENFTPIESEVSSGKVKWVNWQQIGDLLLNTVATENLPLTTRLFCEDLCLLLDSKNLRRFRGIKNILPPEERFEPVDKVFLASETTALRGDFIGFKATLSCLEPLTGPPKAVFFTMKPLYVGLSTSNKLRELTGTIFFCKVD